MSSQPPSLPELKAWQLEQLRLTAFPVDPAGVIDRDWWQEILGKPAESTQRKKLLRTDEGVVDQKSVSLTVDPLRIIWKFEAALIDPLDPPSEVPTLGPLTEALENCLLLCDSILAGLPEIRRIACGLILLQPVEDHKPGYELLDAYLPDVTVRPESTDLHYRINRKRSSDRGLPGLEINRLSTWSVLKWEMRGVVRAGSSFVGGEIQKTSGFACRLELDINTDAERVDVLPKDRLVELWIELVDLGVEIATRGDVP